MFLSPTTHVESPTKHQCVAEACKQRAKCGVYGRVREFLKDLSCEAALLESMTGEQIRKWVWFFIQKQPNNEPAVIHSRRRGATRSRRWSAQMLKPPCEQKVLNVLEINLIL